MDKFYVVGFYEPAYGDALVRADSSSEALTKVRRAGYKPNPGDRYLLPKSGRFPEDHVNADLNSELERLSDRTDSLPDISIIWTYGR